MTKEMTILERITANNPAQAKELYNEYKGLLEEISDLGDGDKVATFTIVGSAFQAGYVARQLEEEKKL